MKYIAYCRKSTDEKDRQVLSIESQVVELKEFALREHLEVIDFITESKTAKEPGREKFAEVLKRIENGEAQGIVSWHPDRLARNSIDGGKVIYLLDLNKLQDLKFPTFWFDNTPQGKFMLNIAFGQSKYYVDNLVENIKRGNRQKLRRGEWPTKAPYGYINDSSTRTIQIDSERSRIIKKAFEKFAEGGHSFTDIANFMHKFGITTAKGKPFKPDQVKDSILTNKMYVGIMKYAGAYYQGTHKLFISRQLFDKVQKEVARIERPRFKGHNFAFRGLARCGECKGAITGEEHPRFYPTTNRNVNFVYYRCTKKKGPCSQKAIREADLENQVREIIQKVDLPEKWAKQWYQWLEKDAIEEEKQAEETINNLKLELATLEEKSNKLLDGYLDGVIEAQTYKLKMNEFFEEKLKIEEKISRIKTDGSFWLEPFKNFIGSALMCAKIARAKNNNHDLANMVKTVGSNFFLTDRQLSLELNQGFAELCAPPSAQSRNSRASEKTSLVDGGGFEPTTSAM